MAWWRGMYNAGCASVVCLASVVSQADESTPNARVLGGARASCISAKRTTRAPRRSCGAGSGSS